MDTMKVNLKRIVLMVEPLAVALIAIFMMLPFKNLIYGQDSSIAYFLHPFSFWGNPFSSLSSIGYGYAIVFNSENIFLDLFVFFLRGLGLNLPLTERVLIIVTIAVSNYGLMLLLNQLYSIASYKRELFLFLTLMLYWFNPFTISVTFFHFEAFFIFQAILPYIFLVVLVLYKRKFLSMELFLSLLVILIYSPGAYASYSVIILFITFFAFLLFLFKYFHERKFGDFIKRVLLLFASLTVEIYFTIALLLFLHIEGQLTLNIITGGENSFNQIYSLFQSESQTTQLYRVISLTAFSWLYSGRGGISYPWFSQFLFITWIGFLVPILFILETVSQRKTAFIYFMIAISVLFIIFSTGDNFPFSGLNSILLGIGGPFLVLTNSYYFSIQVYVLTMSVLLFVLLATLEKENKSFPMKREILHKSRSTLYPKRNAKKTVVSAIAVILALAIIIGSLTPVLQEGEFMTHGPNEDSFVLPQSFTELQSFFQKNYSSPDYYVAIFPLSRIGAIDLNIGNGSFEDSANLFQQIIPYPVLDIAVSNETMVLANLLSSNSTIHISSLLRVAHIKYVVFNPYANMSEWFMNTSPNGVSVNVSSVEHKFMESGLILNRVGSFSVFTVPNVNPVAVIYTEPDFMAAKSLNQYYTTVSQVKNTSSIYSQLLLNSAPLIKSNTSSLDNKYINIFNINPDEANVINTNATDVLYGLNDRGNLIPLNKSSNNSATTISPVMIFSADETNLKNSSTDFNLTNDTLKTTDESYSYLWIKNREFPVNSTIMGNISISNVSGDYRWIYFYLNSSQSYGNLIESFSLLTFNGTNYIQSSLFINNTSIQNRLTWDSVELPQSIGHNVQFRIGVTSNLLNFSIVDASNTYFIDIPTDPVLVPPGGGINKTLAQKINSEESAFNQYSLGIVTINNNLSIQDFSIYKMINVSKVFAFPLDLVNSEIITPSSYSITNGFGFVVHNVSSELYPVFFAANSGNLISLQLHGVVSLSEKFNTSDINLFKVKFSNPDGQILILVGDYTYTATVIYVAITISLFLLVSTIICIIANKKIRDRVLSSH